jgi:hypothetical protein
MMCSKLLSAHDRQASSTAWTEPLFVGLSGGYRMACSNARLRAPCRSSCSRSAASSVFGRRLRASGTRFARRSSRRSRIARRHAWCPITAHRRARASFGYTRERGRRRSSGVTAALHRFRACRGLDAHGHRGARVPAPGSGQRRPGDRAPEAVGRAPKDSENGADRAAARRLQQQQIVQADFHRRIAGIPGVRAAPVNPPALGQRGFASQPDPVRAGRHRTTRRCASGATP